MYIGLKGPFIVLKLYRYVREHMERCLTTNERVIMIINKVKN